MTDKQGLTIEEWLKGLKSTPGDAKTVDLARVLRTKLHGVGREVCDRTAFRYVTGETIPNMDVQRALTRLSRGAVTRVGLARANVEWAKRQAAASPRPPATRRRLPPARTSEEMEADARADHD